MDIAACRRVSPSTVMHWQQKRLVRDQPTILANSKAAVRGDHARIVGGDVTARSEPWKPATNDASPRRLALEAQRDSFPPVIGPDFVWIKFGVDPSNVTL